MGNKIIKLKPLLGKVYVNLNTLRYYTCNVYIHSESAKDWIQIEKSEVDKFITEQKAQIENSIVVTE